MPVGSASRCRELIKSEELINRAQDSVLNENTEDNPPLTPAEVGVIKLLLNKVIPDLKGVEHTGEVDHDIKVSWQK
jgi:hypothetical protein